MLCARVTVLLLPLLWSTTIGEHISCSNKNLLSEFRNLLQESTHNVSEHFNMFKDALLQRSLVYFKKNSMNEDEYVLMAVDNLEDNLKLHLEVSAKNLNSNDVTDKVHVQVDKLIDKVSEIHHQQDSKIRKIIQLFKKYESDISKINVIYQNDINSIKNSITEVRNSLKDFIYKVEYQGNENDIIFNRISQIEGIFGIKKISPKPPKNCNEIFHKGSKLDGVYAISPKENNKVNVWCNITKDTGWTVILLRGPQENHENFNRNWNDYQSGFGNSEKEYWIGLDNLHLLTSDHHQVLRIDMEDWDGNIGWAEYKHFWIDGRKEKYKLHISDFSGNKRDGLSYSNNMMFSTSDHDNDEWASNCAASRKGGFWFKACNNANPTGLFMQKSESTEGIHWYNLRNNHFNLKRIVMKITTQ